MEERTGILLVNTGTPNSYHFHDVKKYLTEFLLDGRVLDIPFWLRELLVKAVIVPFRHKKSARAYASIWTDEGSPLLVHSLTLCRLLQEKLSIPVALGMRYGNPSIATGLETLSDCQKIIVVPLFPQYASATSGSILSEVMNVLSSWQVIPALHFVGPFVTHERFLQAWQQKASSIDFSTYDQILFSFHGLPERQIRKADRVGCCLKADCCETLTSDNYFCYSAQCKYLARELATRLGITNYTITFQSRLGMDKWLSPYTADVIHKYQKEGAKNILLFAPSFVSDCLETLYEIGIELRQEFMVHGGQRLDFVPSLNSDPAWVDAIADIISDSTSDIRRQT